MRGVRIVSPQQGKSRTRASLSPGIAHGVMGQQVTMRIPKPPGSTRAPA
jgi:hypothetical protein